MKDPFHLRQLRRMSRHVLGQFAGRGIILTYHKITEPDVDPWRLSVSAERFAGQMEVLRQQARPVTLEELASRRIDNGTKPAVAVTFDDGYANNLSAAKPILERLGVPATVFVCSGSLGRDREYWWDELADILLRPVRLPDDRRLRMPRLNALNWTSDEFAWRFRTFFSITPGRSSRRKARQFT